MKTTSEKPSWKPAALRAIVKSSARQLNVRNTALQVLHVLLDVVNYQTGHARTGTPKLCEKLGRCERAVKTGLQQLRELGIIYYVGRAGGGKTALYAFRYTRESVMSYNQRQSKSGAVFAPLVTGEYWEEGCKNFLNGVQKNPERGANVTPPSPIVSNSQRNEDTPSRREVDKVPSRDPSARTDALTPVSKFDAVTILGRKGVRATAAGLGAGINTDALQHYGYRIE